jgi:hypothetical protein
VFTGNNFIQYRIKGKGDFPDVGIPGITTPAMKTYFIS